LETGQTLFHVAFPPLTHSVAIAAEFVGDLLIGRWLGLGRIQNDATAENKRLRRRMGADKSFKRLTLL
jgi:hypothetical protein